MAALGCFQRFPLLTCVGYSDHGYRYPLKSDKDPGVLSKTIEVQQAGDYTVWTRGLVGQAGEPVVPNRAFVVDVAGQSLPPTHARLEKSDGEPIASLSRAFVWRRGTVHLAPGKIEITVRKAGGENNAPCPDVIF